MNELVVFTITNTASVVQKGLKLISKNPQKYKYFLSKVFILNSLSKIMYSILNAGFFQESLTAFDSVSSSYPTDFDIKNSTIEPSSIGCAGSFCLKNRPKI